MPTELSEKWDKIGRDILGTARNELYLNMPFLDLALCSLKFTMDVDMKTAGTDGNFIYFEPYSMADFYEKDRRYLNRLYLHMVLHCLFRHLARRGERWEDYWNLSCDIAAEAVIDGMKNRSVRRAADPGRAEVYDMLKKHLSVITAEGVYHVLTGSNMTDSRFQELSALFYVDDHSRWPAPSDDEKSRQQTEKMDKKWRDITEHTETYIAAAGKEAGDNAGELLRQVSIAARRRQDYREFLKKFAVWREEMKIDDDSFDQGFYSYGLRLYGNMPLIEPQEFKEMKKIQDFVIAVDTSASCSGDLLKKFLSETCGILFETESFFKKVNIHIIQCDSKVQSDDIITCREELERYICEFDVKGGGGTDFRPVFDYVEKLRESGSFVKLKGLLYFTDGHGVYPKRRPPYDTAFLFMREDYSARDVPGWAIRLVLTEDDLDEGAKHLDKDIRFV